MSKKKFKQYNHHGNTVWVQEDLQGKHRHHCLCYQCKHFVPEYREENCLTASLLYAVCRALKITTPVWECPNFEESNNENVVSEF